MSPARLLPLVFACLLGPDVPGADHDRELAREPAELITTAGRALRGTLDGFRDGRLHLRLATDGGEVGYSFAPAEIARLRLPGGDLETEAFDLLERGRESEAVPMLEALARHRTRYLPMLDPARRGTLWRALSICATAGDPHAALALVRALEPEAREAGERALLLEAALHVRLRLGDRDEAHALARRWCAVADPSGESALGWRVLAGLAYEAGEYEIARWHALQPVGFSSHLPMRDLDLCHAYAVASADRLGDAAHALALYREMRARGIAWPAGPEFAALGAHLEALAADPAAVPRRHFPPPRTAPSPPVAPVSIHRLTH